MNRLVILRACAAVLGAIGLSLGQGIHDGMKSWEWFKFAFLALGSGAAALVAFLDTSFGKLWHQKTGDPDPAIPDAGNASAPPAPR